MISFYCASGSLPNNATIPNFIPEKLAPKSRREIIVPYNGNKSGDFINIIIETNCAIFFSCNTIDQPINSFIATMLYDI